MSKLGFVRFQLGTKNVVVFYLEWVRFSHSAVDRWVRGTWNITISNLLEISIIFFYQNIDKTAEQWSESVHSVVKKRKNERPLWSFENSDTGSLWKIKRGATTFGSLFIIIFIFEIFLKYLRRTWDIFKKKYQNIDNTVAHWSESVHSVVKKRKNKRLPWSFGTSDAGSLWLIKRSATTFASLFIIVFTFETNLKTQKEYYKLWKLNLNTTIFT